MLANQELVVLDFETTGLSTDSARIIEVGAVLVKGDEVLDTFQSLCNPGFAIPSFITNLTGITSDMLADAPTPEEAMSAFDLFLGDRPVIAHNASFDTRFLRAEMARIDRHTSNPSLCTMLLARRLCQDCQNHKLGTLREFMGIDVAPEHRDHRALDDAMVTAHLWVRLRQYVEQLTESNDHNLSLYQALSQMSKYKIHKHLLGMNNKRRTV